jgi:predicted MFS family arabinose efflux permease
MLGALVVGAVVTERTLFRYYYMGTFLFLVLMAVMSAMLTVAVAVPLLMVIGAASAAFSATQYALIYTLAPPEQRGRATGLLSIFIGSSLVGHYHAGWLFERLGSVSAMQLMAVEGLGALILLGLLWWRNNRGGRN